MISIEELTLRKCILDGKTYSSAQNFYDREMNGRDFLVVNEGDQNNHIELFRVKLREEIGRLQRVYSRKWVA